MWAILDSGGVKGGAVADDGVSLERVGFGCIENGIHCMLVLRVKRTGVWAMLVSGKECC